MFIVIIINCYRKSVCSFWNHFSEKQTSETQTSEGFVQTGVKSMLQDLFKQVNKPEPFLLKVDESSLHCRYII